MRKCGQALDSRMDTSDSKNDERHSGIVDDFDQKGNFGFIVSDSLRKDNLEETVFFHMEDVGDSRLTEGAEVSFAVEYGDRGPVARSVQVESTANDINDTEVFTATTGQSVSSGEDDTNKTEMYEPDSGGTTTNNGRDRSTDSPAYCPYCGTDLSDHMEGTFCSNCGEEL